ncbi:hypothetical protein Tco_0033389 [Tanacetum coccineum]
MEQPQQITPANQLVHSSKYQTVRRCNNYALLLNILCLRVCWIMGQLLVDHALSYALTATADVPAVYLQHFWKTVKQVLNANEAIRFMKFESIPKRLEEEYHLTKDDTSLVNVYATRKVTVQGMLIPNDLLIDEIRDTQAYKDYVEEYGRVEVPMIQPELVEYSQGTYRIPRATRTPNPDDVVQKKKRKGKPIAGEAMMIKKRDEIHEATLLSLALHKTAKIVEEQENVAAVTEKLLEEDMEKLVEGEDDDSEAMDFDDLIFLNDEEYSATRIEPGSHKENPKTINDDDEEEDKKKDDKKDDNDDDDQDDHSLFRTRRTSSSEIRNKKGLRRYKHPFLYHLDHLGKTYLRIRILLRN